MSIIVVGLNHKTAPVEVRELLAFNDATITSALQSLVDSRTITEGMIISTCNRVEILAGSVTEADRALDHVRRFLYEFHNLNGILHNDHLYEHIDHTAVRHLFRVASSLDSMVIGETQILGQVKTAYQKAVESRTIGRVLNQLMTRAFSVAKRVRTETEIGSASISVSSVAVDLAKKVFDELSTKSVMLIGAGEMTELAARYLVNEGVRQFIICNRTKERALELADTFGGEAIDFADMHSYLSRADIVICSTGAAEYVITVDTCKRALEARRNRPQLLIDISVPRNIDPSAGSLDNLFLIDIDDLETVVNTNARQRQREAIKAEAIIEREVELFFEKIGSIELGPTIAALKEHLTEIALAEYTRTRAKLGPLSPEQEEAIKEHLLGSLVNKFLHPLIVSLREGVRTNSDGCDILELYHNVYNLKERLKIREGRELVEEREEVEL
jgi:glutamyl-tRNA reductase